MKYWILPVRILLASLSLFLLNIQTLKADTVPTAAWHIQVMGTDQQLHSLAEFKGKTLWIDFWASWCGPCRQSFPWLNSLHQQLSPQQFTVVAINVDENLDDAHRFLSMFSPNFPVLFDPEGKLAELFQVPVMPSSFLVAPDGRILLQHKGFRPDEAEQLSYKIRSYLQGKTP